MQPHSHNQAVSSVGQRPKALFGIDFPVLQAKGKRGRLRGLEVKVSGFGLRIKLFLRCLVLPFLHEFGFGAWLGIEPQTLNVKIKTLAPESVNPKHSNLVPTYRPTGPSTHRPTSLHPCRHARIHKYMLTYRRAHIHT